MQNKKNIINHRNFLKDVPDKEIRNKIMDVLDSNQIYIGLDKHKIPSFIQKRRFNHGN